MPRSLFSCCKSLQNGFLSSLLVVVSGWSRLASSLDLLHSCLLSTCLLHHNKTTTSCSKLTFKVKVCDTSLDSVHKFLNKTNAADIKSAPSGYMWLCRVHTDLNHSSQISSVHQQQNYKSEKHHLYLHHSDLSVLWRVLGHWYLNWMHWYLFVFFTLTVNFSSRWTWQIIKGLSTTLDVM